VVSSIPLRFFEVEQSAIGAFGKPAVVKGF
jgi:hypothetical protein